MIKLRPLLLSDLDKYKHWKLPQHEYHAFNGPYFKLETKEEIVRLGISTWSGNIGMIKLAKKVGMKKEAEYRNARIIKGQYFDAVSYGILKTEWLLSRD